MHTHNTRGNLPNFQVAPCIHVTLHPPFARLCSSLEGSVTGCDWRSVAHCKPFQAEQANVEVEQPLPQILHYLRNTTTYAVPLLLGWLFDVQIACSALL